MYQLRRVGNHRHFVQRLVPRNFEQSWHCGRSLTSDVLIQSCYASRNHCKISRRTDGFYIKDLKSANGTLVNDNDIGDMECRLEVGDIVGFGVPRSKEAEPECFIVIFERVTSLCDTPRNFFGMNSFSLKTPFDGVGFFKGVESWSENVAPPNTFRTLGTPQVKSEIEVIDLTEDEVKTEELQNGGPSCSKVFDTIKLSKFDDDIKPSDGIWPFEGECKNEGSDNKNAVVKVEHDEEKPAIEGPSGSENVDTPNEAQEVMLPQIKSEFEVIDITDDDEGDTQGMQDSGPGYSTENELHPWNDEDRSLGLNRVEEDELETSMYDDEIDVMVIDELEG